MTVPYNTYAHGAALAKTRMWWDLSGDKPKMRQWVKCPVCDKSNEDIHSCMFYIDESNEHWYFCDLDTVCSRCGLISDYRITVSESMYDTSYADDAELHSEED